MARATAEDEFYSRRKGRSLSGVIGDAARARTSDAPKHPHQYRIPQATLNAFALKLLNLEGELRKAKNFDTLHEIVWASRIKGIGTLACYDTAHRIGSYLGLEPEVVYLHQGTKAGALTIGLRGVRGRLDRSLLPLELQALSAKQVEDLLCIFKGYLETGDLNLRGCGCGSRGRC